MYFLLVCIALGFTVAFVRCQPPPIPLLPNPALQALKDITAVNNAALASVINQQQQAGGGVGETRQSSFVSTSNGKGGGGTVIVNDGKTIVLDASGKPVDTDSKKAASIAHDVTTATDVRTPPRAAVAGGAANSGESVSQHSGVSIVNDNGKVSGVVYKPDGSVQHINADLNKKMPAESIAAAAKAQNDAAPAKKAKA